MDTPRRSLSVARHRVALLVAALAATNIAGADLLYAQPRSAAAPSDANVKKGIDLYKKGQALLESGKFSDALAKFRESNSLLPSPNTRLYIARCLVKTNDHVAAYREFEGVVADAKERNDPKYDGAVSAAGTEKAEIAGKIALVTLNVTSPQEGTRVSVAGNDVPRASWGSPIPMAPGSVEVTITTPPGPPSSQTLKLNAGDKPTVTLEGKPTTAGPDPSATATTPGSSRSVLRPIAYAAGGVGVAGMIMFGVAGALANVTYSDLDGKCAKGMGSRSCPNDTKSLVEQGKLQKDLANVGLIVGGVGLAAGVTLFILSRGGSEPKKEEGPTVQPVAGPGYIGVQGSF